MQGKINREGPNNPMFGITKSPETIAKLQNGFMFMRMRLKGF